jgi:polar amino acid transport system permease protein
MSAKLFDFQAVLDNIPEILKFLPVTLELAVTAMIFGLLLGLLVAIIKIKQIPVLTPIANLYISILRGTPILVQLYVAYFGVPMFLKALNLKFGWNLNVNGVPGFVYAAIAMSINESAYNAETIRAALQSVGTGQIEAANALGMTYFQALYRIILPEAITVALPNLVNSFIGLIKGTSLAFTCAVVEMTAEGKIIGGRTYRYFEVYVSLALIYWMITIVIEQTMKVVEKKLAIPDQIGSMDKGDKAGNERRSSAGSAKKREVRQS